MKYKKFITFAVSMKKAKIRTVASILVLATILLLSAICFRQHKQLVFYRGYCDSVIPVYIKKIDSLDVQLDTVKNIVLRLTYQEMLIQNIQRGLTAKEDLIMQNPEAYFTFDSKQENLGGGE